MRGRKERRVESGGPVGLEESRVVVHFVKAGGLVHLKKVGERGNQLLEQRSCGAGLGGKES